MNHEELSGWPRFSGHFFGGMVVGGALAGLLVLFAAWVRIEDHRAFEDDLMSKYAAALVEVERLREGCGGTP